MAQADNTLAGLIQMNNMNNADIDVTDLLQSAPWLKEAYATEASNGTLHSYLKETLAAGVAFRDPNTGIANVAGQETEVSVALKLMDASLVRDKGIAMKYSKGGIPAYMAKQGMKSIKSAFKNAEKQLINGTDNDATGNNGLADTLDAIGGFCYSNGGAVANSQTSVYFLFEGEDDVAVIAGNDGVLDIGDVVEQRVSTNSTGTEGYTGLTQSILGWLGLQVGSIHSCARLANVDAVAPLTDDKIAGVLAGFPADKRPTRILMNSASQEQLRSSRTATSPSGAPAPVVEQAFNIPITVTDSIVSTEAVVTA
ncbi:MAG: hypothetical protein GY750_21010 [Lentisphaerae bacterium]|nr:hypothetical protein [Lentisphaerota bacterium]